MGLSIGDILLSILPMLLLVGAWVFFMRRMQGGDDAQLQRRKVEALERIAAALEKRQ